MISGSVKADSILMLIFSHESKKILSIVWDKLFKEKIMPWILLSLNNSIQLALTHFLFPMFYAAQARGSHGTAVKPTVLIKLPTFSSPVAKSCLLDQGWKWLLWRRYGRHAALVNLQSLCQVLWWQHLCMPEKKPEKQHMHCGTPDGISVCRICRRHVHVFNHMQRQPAHRHAQHHMRPKGSVNRILN